MIRQRAALSLAALLAALTVSSPVTLARFTAGRTATASFATGTILPPTSLAGTGGATASLTWTASTSTTAAGYRVLRSATSGAGYAQVGTVTPVAAASASDSPGAGTWYYVLDTYLGGWTSAHSNEASVSVTGQVTTPTAGCDPTMQTAETSGSGNDDGYESNPGSACDPGGGSATDARSGTTTVDDCANAGKDRHRFWGYALGLPAVVTSIDGITVTAIVGMSNNGGTPSICLQLSGDGGLTWTGAKKVALSGTALATYAAGSASDTWGSTWTLAQLTSTAFRIRVTDVTTTPNKDFRLDYLGASVSYTP